jgi:hypothetical protein
LFWRQLRQRWHKVEKRNQVSEEEIVAGREARGCSTPGGNEAINVFAFHEKGPGWHDECKICKSGGSEVEWSQCHPSCGGGGLDLVFLSIVKAAGNGNVRAVLMLAPYAPRYVDVNLARSSVQVRSCTGAVIANLRFHDADRTSALRIARTGIADAAASHNPSPFDILSPPAGF